MDYIRKKHLVTYNSDKCKMYLRNDFRFECAYCGVRELDNVVGENFFEKDHFLARTSSNSLDTDSYENMVYACSKCNGTKSNKNITLLLDPCKDDIYSGSSPNLIKLGEEDNYRLKAMSESGEAFIESLQLNSGYYRQMREKQIKNNVLLNTLNNLIQNGSLLKFPEQAEIINEYLKNIRVVDEYSDEYKCGVSKAGEDVLAVLKKLKDNNIKYLLKFDDYDLDVELIIDSEAYYCEIKVSDYIGENKKGPNLNSEKIIAWEELGQKCGVLYFYKNMGMLEVYKLNKGKLIFTCQL